jgi:hypothetical protein
VAAVPAGDLVVNLTASFSVDPSGIAFATIPSTISTDGGAAGFIWSSTFSGAVSTAYPVPGDAIPGQVESDADNIYFSTSGFSSDAGLYSVPHAGGTATPLFVRSGDILSGLSVDAFTLDANNVYVTVTDTSPTTPTGSIYSILKGTTTPISIYTAPMGLTIDNVFVDGSTLWWTEGDIIDQRDTTIQSATLGGTLTPTLFATIHQPLVVDQMVEAMATVAFVYFNITLAGDGGFALANGIYTVTQGGTPTAADTSGIFPIAIGPGGAVYYPSFSGIRKLVLGGGAATTVVPNVGALGVAVDSSGTLYYATSNCIDKL